MKILRYEIVQPPRPRRIQTRTKGKRKTERLMREAAKGMAARIDALAYSVFFGKDPV